DRQHDEREQSAPIADRRDELLEPVRAPCDHEIRSRDKLWKGQPARLVDGGPPCFQRSTSQESRSKDLRGEIGGGAPLALLLEFLLRQSFGEDSWHFLRLHMKNLSNLLGAQPIRMLFQCAHHPVESGHNVVGRSAAQALPL